MNSVNLSKGESAIYDRQLRLWGSSAQMRIKSSTVAIVGLTLATVEIAKNMVLAGSNLLLQDSRAVTENTSNFLIKLEVDDVSGLSVGDATAIAVRRLNEHPKVDSCVDWNASGKSSVTSLVVSFSYIDYDVHEAIAMSNKAREMSISFFLVVDSNVLCWSFSDLQTHVVEEYTAPLKRDDRTGNRVVSTRAGELFEFVSLSEYISSELKISKKQNDMYKFMHFYLGYLYTKNQPGSPKNKRLRLGGGLGEYIKMNNNQSNDKLDYLSTCMEFENHKNCLPHFAAIHGALISQEIIKYITKKDPPLFNTILLANDGAALVYKHPSTMRHVQPTDEDEVQCVVEAASGFDLDLD